VKQISKVISRQFCRFCAKLFRKKSVLTKIARYRKKYLKFWLELPTASRGFCRRQRPSTRWGRFLIYFLIPAWLKR
jgi:hypothetical protein